MSQATTTFGQWLRGRRKAVDLTQEQLAERIGCSLGTIRKIEAGERRPSRQVADLMADHLKVPTEERRAFVEFARGLGDAPSYVEELSSEATLMEQPYRRTPTNLPAQPTAFVGREKELAIVRSMFWKAGVRLVTLAGPPGIGKTRLGIEVAAELLDDFADGVFFVPLAPINDPELVASKIATILGVRESADQPIADALKQYLHDKQMLLVLDNFEQVLDAAMLVAELLTAAPRLKVLVTSRAVLHLRGEKEFPVPPLSLPDPKESIDAEALSRYEAVELFIERASDVKYDFTLTPENSLPVAEICRRLEGLPLAIELAAARIKILSPQGLLGRLESRLTILTGGARDLLAHQKTLNSAIEWSYELLDQEEQRLFNALGVFVGGCSLDAVERICFREGNTGDGDRDIRLLNSLTALKDKSLLRLEAQKDGEPRFGMLETIRAYAFEQLEASGTANAIRSRHAQYFAELAEESEAWLWGPTQSDVLDLLEVEHDNIRQALRWCADSELWEPALHLAARIWRFWYIRGYIPEGRNHLEGAIRNADCYAPELTHEGGEEHASSESWRADLAEAVFGAGWLAWMQGDLTGAAPLFERSLGLYRQVGDKRGVARALNKVGDVAGWGRDFNTMEALYRESLLVSREAGDLQGIGARLSTLGTMEYSYGNYEQAREYYEESLQIKRALGDKRLIANTLIEIGQVVEGEDEACSWKIYEEALALYRDVHDKRGIATTLNNMGQLAHRRKHLAQARSLYEDGLEIRREIGDRWGVAWSLNNLGRLWCDEGDFAQARSFCAESLKMRTKIWNPRSLAESFETFARIVVMEYMRAGEDRNRVQKEQGGQRELNALEKAVRLLAVAETLREANRMPVLRQDKSEYDQTVFTLRRLVPQAIFYRDWEEGQAMPLEQAIAYALEEAAP